MARRIRRLACLAAALLLVAVLAAAGTVTASAAEQCYLVGDVHTDSQIDEKDAIQLLYAYMSEVESDYPSDINGDGKVNHLDAILIKGMIGQPPVHAHVYYEAVWDWTDYEQTNEVKVTLYCACGANEEKTVAYTVKETVEPGCTTAGKETYLAECEGFTSEQVKSIDALGHKRDTSNKDTCACTRCKEGGDLHTWQVESTDPATCRSNAVENQKCVHCGDIRQITLENTAGQHLYVYLEDRLVEEKACEWVKIYKCQGCSEEIKGTAAGDTYTTHTYRGVVTTVATCRQEGVKTYTCDCGASYTEDLPMDPGNHVWTTEDQVRYTCACGAEKTVVQAEVVEGNADAGQVNASDLDKEVALPNNVTLTMDTEAQENLGNVENVVITVGKVEAAELELSDEQREQIGDTVYNLNLTADGTDISTFGGYVTITLPYTLGEGETADDYINIWYITDEGEVEAMKGTYSDGFVTFQTNHFSYYTVTRLTPEQRCELYGHSEGAPIHRDATCTANGLNYQTCKRCGKVLVDEVLPALGHDYVQTVCEATCEQGGTITKACQRQGCNASATANIDKLGHTLELVGEEAATCTTAGWRKYKCSRDGCVKVHTETVEQLEHEYEWKETVDATCTTSGHDVYECKHEGCSATEKRNVVPALGHDYQVSGWNWSEDHSSAQAALVCANDPSHTHTQKATVAINEGTKPCLGEHTVTFTATATYNNTTFTGTAEEQRSSEIGHTTGAWISTPNGHSHKCTVCGAVLDTADHNWKVGTVKDAGCLVDGSKTSSCVVCGYEKTEVIPAVGTHNFVAGICTVCGKEEETDCKHLRTYPVALDVSAYGICSSTSITLYKCDCGQVQNYDIEKSGCAFEYSEEQLEDGTWAYYSICSKCGLTLVETYPEVLHEDLCRLDSMGIVTASIQGTEVFRMERVYDSQKHPTTVLVDTTTLPGFCEGLTIEIYQCPCGELSGHNFEGACQFWYDDERSTDTETWMVCEGCGGYRVSANTYETVGCESYTYANVRYIYDGETVGQFVREWVYEDHIYEMVSYEMDGDSCEDGILVNEVCVNCGDEHSVYTRYHYEVNEEIVDLSDYNICYDTMSILTCPCEDHSTSYYFYGEECSWEWGYNEEGGYYEYVCSVCGTHRHTETVFHSKDEHCMQMVENITYYTDSNGETMFTLSSSYKESRHNAVDYKVELYGDSCLDGGVIYSHCLDCGTDLGSRVFEANSGHPTYLVERVDIASAGSCSDEIWLSICGCGADVTATQFGNNCSWEWLEGGEMCPECGIRIEFVEEVMEKLGQCMAQMRTTVTVCDANGRVLGSLTGEGPREVHNKVSKNVLLQENGDCTGGWYYRNYCADCGEVFYDGSLYNDIRYYHETNLVYEEIVGETDCGQLVMRQFACACGENGYQYLSAGCSFDYDRYDATTGAEIFRCTECGLERWYTSEQAPTGNGCQITVTDTYTYQRNGEEVYRYTDSRTAYQHETIHKYTLVNPEGTCEDGFHYQEICANCGVLVYDSQAAGEDPRTGHYSWTVAINHLHDGTGLCGAITQRVDACACGEYSSTGMYWSCEFEYGYDKQGRWTRTCIHCGLTIICTSTVETPDATEEEPCRTMVTETYEAYLGDELLFTYTNNYQSVDHTEAYRFTMLGESCTDGYHYERYCTVCNEVIEASSEVQYGHSNWTMSEEQITYEGICGTIWKNDWSCACGQRSGTSIYTNGCSMMYDHQDEITGASVEKCADCGLERWEIMGSWIPTGEPCRVARTDIITYKMGGEVVTSLKRVEYASSHGAMVYALTPVSDNHSDGFTVTGICQNCGETDNRGSNVYYCGDQSWVVEYTTLCDVEGACSPFYWTKRVWCYCEEDVSYDWGGSCCFDHIGYSAELGDQYRCSVCGLERTWKRTGSRVEGACQWDYTIAYTMSFGGQQVASGTLTYRETVHDTYCQFNLLGTTCTDGYTVTYRCKNCDHAETMGDPRYEHSCEYIGTFGSAELGLCEGSEISVYSCACGQVGWINSNFNNCNYNYRYTETEDGYSTVYTCNDCGLSYQCTAVYTAAGESCQYTMSETTLLLMNGELKYDLSRTIFTDRHEYTETAVLKDGADSCEDGVIIYQNCTKCGHTSSWETSYHHSYRVEADTIDLSEYGAVCGTKLVHYSCGCGKNSDWRLEGECDLDQEYISYDDTDWGFAVLNTSQTTTAGSLGYYSYLHEYRCAVTEPACGLVLRRADYWTAEGCVATRYIAWLYYDGTQWQYLVAPEAVETLPFHNYADGESYETDLDDGGRTLTETYTCDCGSSYTRSWTYDSTDYHCRTDEVALGTDPNFYAKMQSTTQYAKIEGYGLVTLDERFYYDASGNAVEGWKSVYTYDTDACCRYIKNYDYTGALTGEQSHEYHADSGEWCYEPTCTQKGTTRCLWCDLPEVVYDSYGHSFQWSETENTYVCAVCGLENANGASGSIALEDMSTETTYVVGYENLGNVDFEVYTMVIVDGQEIVLDVTLEQSFFEKNGIDAVSISKEELDAAAKAIAGEADYSIRIVFVPADDSTDLDYAITLDKGDQE